jgi:hypothetical protein
MRILVLILLTFSMSLSICVISCSRNFELAATNTSIGLGNASSSDFKHNREDVVIYLKAINTIINDLSQTIAPYERISYQYGSGDLTNYISAFQQAVIQINVLKSPNISDVKQDQEVRKKLLNDWINVFLTYKEKYKYMAPLDREDLQILTSLYQQELELNIISERFQLTYNIPALEVNYEACHLIWDEGGWGNPAEAQSGAAKDELRSIQQGMDFIRAESSGRLFTAVTSATNDMGAFPTGNPLYPNYLRWPKTMGTYTCDSSGFVTQVSTGY